MLRKQSSLAHVHFLAEMARGKRKFESAHPIDKGEV